MQRHLILTNDGSLSISVPDLKVTYHSIHGAITESKHVFIEAGLKKVIENFREQPLNILEMGLGTALNAFLTLLESEKLSIQVCYEAIEQFPLLPEEYMQLQYPSLLSKEKEQEYQKLHSSDSEKEIRLANYFTFIKRNCSLPDYFSAKKFHLVYFDAFAPAAQPELWTHEVFLKLFSIMEPGGVLVTYCAKGDVRRAMMRAGFKVERLQGPPHKREMLRANRL